MVLLIVLLILLAILAAVAVFTLGLVGTTFWVLFGDLIVFAIIIWLIVKIFRRKK